MPKEKVTIKIPRPLYDQLKELIKNTGFSSVNEFIVYAMRDIVSGGRLESPDEFSREEINIIKERLRKLGYIE